MPFVRRQRRSLPASRAGLWRIWDDHGMKPNWTVLGSRYPLSLRDTIERGRCLISIGDIPGGATIEVGPVQVLPVELAAHVNAFNLGWMIAWTPKGAPPTLAMPLGLFGLCNHSSDPSAELAIDYKRRLVQLIARQELGEGDEITIRYRVPPHSCPSARHIK